MQRYRVRVMLPALTLAAILMWGFGPAGALAQCGGSYSGMHGQQMGNSGHMGSGQMGMYGTQAPVQEDPNAVAPAPGYFTPVSPPVPGSPAPQNIGDRGQMMRQGSKPSGHTGHMGQQ